MLRIFWHGSRTRPVQKLALPRALLTNDGGARVHEGDQADSFHIHTYISTGAHRLYARLIRDRPDP